MMDNPFASTTSPDYNPFSVPSTDGASYTTPKESTSHNTFQGVSNSYNDTVQSVISHIPGATITDEDLDLKEKRLMEREQRIADREREVETARANRSEERV